MGPSSLYGDLNETQRSYPPSVIGLYSSGPQSGKSTVANHLVSTYGYTVVKFAGPLKAMLRGLLEDIGYPPDTIWECIEGGLKEHTLDSFKASPRRLMQTLGHEWGRCQIDTNLWVNLFKEKVDHILLNGGCVVCDDMRYANEASAIRSYDNNALWRIICPATPQKFPHHPSEGGLDSAVFSHNLWNTGSLQSLLSGVDDLLRGHMRDVGLSQ